MALIGSKPVPQAASASRPGVLKLLTIKQHSALDEFGQPKLSANQALSGLNAPECGSHSGARWYVVQTHFKSEAEAHLRLLDQDFAAFLPLVRRRRRDVLEHVPLFPTYLFVLFDRAQQQWRCIHHTRGVKRLFSANAERPLPVQTGAVEALLKAASLRAVVVDAPAVLIQAGARLRVLDGPFADQQGVCLWTDAQRVGLLIQLFGREVEVPFDRRDVQAALAGPGQ